MELEYTCLTDQVTESLKENFLNRPLDSNTPEMIRQHISRMFLGKPVRFDVLVNYDEITVSPLDIYTGLLFAGFDPDPYEVISNTVNGVYKNSFGSFSLVGGSFCIYPNAEIKSIKVALEDESDGCLHKSCPECHGTGRKPDGGWCVHMISCPCPKCTPYC